MPLPVLVGRPRQAWALCSDVPNAAQVLVAAFWPGPLTLILPMAEGLSWELGETRGGVAVRMPAHDDLLDLIMMIGPLGGHERKLSAASRPRRRLPRSRRVWGTRSRCTWTGGRRPADIPSTIVDLTRWRPKVTREGAIPRAEIDRALEEGGA